MRVLAGVVVLVAACTTAPKCPTPAAPVAAPATGGSATATGKLEMRSYYLVLLRRGPTWTADKTPASTKLFEGHMANIEAMAKQGKLLIAGPMDADPADKTAIAGIFLFDVPTKEQVVDLMKADPAMAAGRLVPEILTWYGPANITYPGKAIPQP